MRSRRRWALAAALGALVSLGGPALPVQAQGPASPAQDWKKEFEEICARTQDSMALPLEELRSLVARSDRLKPQIERLDESQRKVYLRRLQACRDLYQFVIESRERG